MNNSEFLELKTKGLEFLKSKKNIKAMNLLEKALSIQFDDETEEALSKASYMAIWDSYTAKNFEQMERAANLSISINSKEKYYNPLILAKSYNGLSIALYNLGKSTIENNLKAKKIYDDILSNQNLTKSEKKQIIKSKIYNDVGIIINLGQQGNLDDSTLLCEENIALCTEYNMQLELGVTYKVYGELLHNFGKVEESLTYFREALKIFLSNKDNTSFQHHIGDTYLKVASNFVKDGNYEQALVCIDSAFPYLEKVGRNAYRFYYIRGMIYEYYGELDKAGEYYDKAFNMLLNLRLSLETESNVDGFLKKEERENTFKNAIKLQYKMDNIAKALELLEKYRGKEFIEKVLKGKRSLLLGIPHGLMNERNSIEQEIKSVFYDEKLSNEQKNKKIANLENKLYFCEEKIASSKKVYKLYGESINIELNDILKKVQERLKNNQVIISYFYCNDGVYITLIKSREVISEYIEISNSNFDEALKNFLDYIRKYNITQKSSKKILSYYLNNISNYLFNPIEKYINNNMELVIVPFETLHTFPLHILFFEKLKDISISFMPSLASILYIHPDKKKLDNVCIFADPRSNLPNVVNEVEKIPTFFNNNKILFRDDASKSAFLENWDKYEVLHYSGHFKHKYDKPLYSYIECSNNENITLSNIYEFSSENISFLSLGGCSSGLSRVYKGEELTGMIRGFFYAGVKSILATLWDVEDKSASDFFILFYEKLQEFRGDKKKALSFTYSEMKEKYQHLFFYAPFVLYEGLY